MIINFELPPKLWFDSNVLTSGKPFVTLDVDFKYSVFWIKYSDV